MGKPIFSDQLSVIRDQKGPAPVMGVGAVLIAGYR